MLKVGKKHLYFHQLQPVSISQNFSHLSVCMHTFPIGEGRVDTQYWLQLFKLEFIFYIHIENIYTYHLNDYKLLH